MVFGDGRCRMHAGGLIQIPLGDTLYTMILIQEIVDEVLFKIFTLLGRNDRFLHNEEELSSK